MSHSPYLGEIMLWTGSAIPPGWAICDGSLLLINDHPDLYPLIGTTYGGDGVTTFAVPDLRGSIPLHQGTGLGGSQYVMGQKAGIETSTLTTNQIPAHTHAAAVRSTSGTSNAPTGLVLAGNAAGSLHYGAGADTAMDPASLATSGGGQAHNNMQPYLVMNYLIALSGVYPTQT